MTFNASSTDLLASSSEPASYVLGDLVDAEISKVLTQYRESPNLLGVISAYLEQVADIMRVIHTIPLYFDLDTAVGEQLTLLGKRLGFPRCHCICTIAPVFGFECDGGYGGPYDIAGFCEEGTWIDCRDTGTSTICIDDDEVYRQMLKARRYQVLGLYDADSLQAAAEHIWGETAQVVSLGLGRVVVSPGRPLTTFEVLSRAVAFRALPIAPGIKSYTSAAVGPIFGFGTGWFGFCEGAVWLCPTDPYPYACP